ncbi:MAG: transglycosylase SLT domain-containing protein [Synergistaceae bacterium]|nr:transglycosylase SLT domain-containing protein [Synergistaceae bacterium]MBQ6971064.1 transglycosylase SLT domain-containing protein [Synergistaceae bacterium]
MKTNKLILPAIFLLLMTEASFSAAKNEALSVIREITASQVSSSRKASPKPARKASSPEIDPRARNIYALFTKVNPKLDQASAKKYAEIVIEAAGKYKQDPYVIAAIIVHESTVNSKALSKGGDYGLMQVRWKVHEKAIKQRFPNVRKAGDMFDARTNIMFGTEIFSDCMRKAGNDAAKGLMRYSAGNTKMRDKVIATVKELRAQDNAMKTISIQKKKGK